MEDARRNGISQDELELLQVQEVGEEVRRFLETPTGMYFTKRCEADRESAVEDLIAADPEDAKAQRDIRMRIQLADTFGRYIADIITEAKNAAQMLEMIEAESRQ